ncbi:MAG: exodeoxyribonuclease III [Spirochaetota bacterium]
MKIISLNCNGIRAAASKGLHEFIEKQAPDIVAFQEIKAEKRQIDLSFWRERKYIPYIFSAKKKGYSGTAVFTKKKPVKCIFGMEHELFDFEGRNIIVEYKNFTFINTYYPSGTSGTERQDIKMKFLEHMSEKKAEWEKKYKNLILCGDVNICHAEADIHNPKGNEKNSGFLPEERKWLSEYLESGLIDTFRHFHPKKKDSYTWWTYRFHARENNKGWRIDYFFVTKNLEKKLRSTSIAKDVVVSDHAPLILEIAIR